MLIKELSRKQIEFLEGIFSENPPGEEELEDYLERKGCKLYQCISCQKLIFHDNYEFWNLTDCCDDNSKITPKGLLCEVCYARSPENMKHWILFKPSWYKNVEFEGGGQD